MRREVGEIIGGLAVNAINPLNEGHSTNQEMVTRSEMQAIMSNLSGVQYNLLAAKYLLDGEALVNLAREWGILISNLAENNSWSRRHNLQRMKRITLCEALSPFSWTNGQRLSGMGLQGRNGANLTRYQQALKELTIIEAEALDTVRRNL